MLDLQLLNIAKVTVHRVPAVPGGGTDPDCSDRGYYPLSPLIIAMKKCVGMKTFRIYILATMLGLLSFAGALGATEPVSFKVESIHLSQPDEVLQTRLGGAKELAAYIKQLEASLEASFQAVGNVRANDWCRCCGRKAGPPSKVLAHVERISD